MQRRTIELTVMFLLVLVSLSILFLGKSMVDGGMESGMSPLFLPRIIAVLMLVFCTMGIYEAVKKQGAGGLETDLVSVAKHIGIFFIYFFVLPYIGFMVATSVMMFVIMYQMGGRNLLVMAVVSISGSVIIYYAGYHLLKVLLPVGSLFE